MGGLSDGQGTIIYSILHRRRGSLQHDNLHQLLLGLSFSDLLASWAVVMGGFLYPKGVSDDAPLALGNAASCNASAFVNALFGTSSTLYNCWISMHFWRVLRKTQKRQSQSTKMDWCFRVTAHSSAVLVGFVFATIGILGDRFGPHYFLGMCYFTPPCSDSNEDCAETSGFEVNHVFRGFLALCVIISIGCTIAVALKVRANLKRSRKYSTSQMSATQTTFGGDSNRDFTVTSQEGGPTANSGIEMELESSAGKGTPKTRSKEQDVAFQAVWYTIAHLNTVVLPIVGILVVNMTDEEARKGDPGHYTFLLLLYWFMPIQGALNMIVFLRPRYIRWQEYLERQNLGHRSRSQPNEETNTQQPSKPSWHYLIGLAILEDIPARGGRRQAGRCPSNVATRNCICFLLDRQCCQSRNLLSRLLL
ncbi:expressed unknown protein [Seminavis robusta]|uniref:Uncharacterized protein n=1 Tax=Seminavis robusta TaxID=568900 RepID=A0A9N8DZG1_9STRA|nr:expressed unknown protein [Seminavis robusta]|eukprot:Sro500_g155250.1 n/a (420) ;mRNA; f:22714-24138